MFNFKWGIIAGAGAFILSLGVALVSGVRIPFALLRAGIFAVLFFGAGLGIRALIDNFIPELLSAGFAASGQEDTLSRPGSRINITLGDNRDGAMPEAYRNSGDPEEMGNIADLLSGAAGPAETAGPPGRGMDQNGEDSYTYTKGGGQGIPAEGIDQGFSPESQNQESSVLSGLAEASAEPVFTPSFGESGGLGSLPDLDAMAGAFLNNAGEEASPAAGGSARLEISPLERKAPGSKDQNLQGDYSPKELAEGIRTILTKEKDKG